MPTCNILRRDLSKNIRAPVVISIATSYSILFDSELSICVKKLFCIRQQVKVYFFYYSNLYAISFEFVRPSLIHFAY